MHPFHSLFTDEPDTEYVPDRMGRLGQGGFVVKPDPEPIGTPDARFDEFRAAERRGDGLSDLFGANPVSIKGPVGPIAPNRRADVGKIETFLDRTGDFDLARTEGPTGFFGTTLQDAITNFQGASGLKPDGLLNPGGETIGALANTLKGQIKPSARKHAAPIAPRGAGTGAGQGTLPVNLPPGGGLPRAVAPEFPGLDRDPGGTAPRKDPLEDFKKADRESMKGLTPSGKPNTTHRDAERTGERRLTRKIEEETRAFLERAKTANRASNRLEPLRMVPTLGPLVPPVRIDKIIGAFEHYLDGKGGVVNYDPKWMLKHPKLQAAAKRNESNFENWILGTGERLSEPKRVSRILSGLNDGQTRTANKVFEGRYLFDRTKDKFSDHRLLLGKGVIRATGKFIYTRNGDGIRVTGMVEQKISDPFDFTSGRFFTAPGERISHDDMIWLDKHGKAKIFEVRSIWRRKFTWRLRIVRDPISREEQIIGVGKPRWTDAK